MENVKNNSQVPEKYDDSVGKTTSHQILEALISSCMNKNLSVLVKIIYKLQDFISEWGEVKDLGEGRTYNLPLSDVFDTLAQYHSPARISHISPRSRCHNARQAKTLTC